MNIVYGATRLLLKSLVRIFGNYEVYGKENVPRNGPLIVVANHVSDIDAALLYVIMPRRVEFMAKADLFKKPGVSQLFKIYGAFPINENGMEFHAVNHSLDLLKRNRVVGMFPEGAKNPSALGRAMLGSATIAMMSGAPILPVGITGTESAEISLRMGHSRGSFRIIIGEPFFVPEEKDKRLREDVEIVTDTIMNRIAQLLPECYRGVYHNDWQGKRSYTSPPDWLRLKKDKPSGVS